MAEAPHSIDGSHRLEIVLAIQLPTQKTPQAQPPLRSRYVWACEGSQNLIAKNGTITHCNSVYPTLSDAAPEEKTKERRCQRVDNELHIKTFRRAGPQVVRLGIGENNCTKFFGVIFHHQL